MLRTLALNNTTDRQQLNALIERLRSQVDGSGEIAEQVATIVQDVRTNGDEAIVRYMRQWTNPNFTADIIQVSPNQLADAANQLDPDIRTALEQSIDNVRAYQSHILPKDPPTVTIDGAQLGLRFTPIQKVGLHVPGGKAAYPSSVIMLAVPAQIAGVEDISIVCPPPTGGGEQIDVSPLVLGTAHLLGVNKVYRIGGAQAIAALACGSQTVDPVHFIAGPGNAYTQQAKRQLFGQIGIDGFFGPSEVVIIADESARPDWIASDLLAQAEHDPGCCFLISTSKEVVNSIVTEVKTQLRKRNRREAIEKALSDWSSAIVALSESEAIEIADEIAAEHVTLAVKDPHDLLSKSRNGGAWFLGHGSPVATGDYYAGPSHCLPTSSTARYTSGLSVYTFLKRSSVEHYPTVPDAHTIAHVAALAEAEGLDAHAHSVRIRAT